MNGLVGWLEANGLVTADDHKWFMIGLAAALDASRPSHRLVAWLLLAAVVGPFVFTLWAEFGFAG